MIGTENRKCAIGNSLQQRIDVCLRTQRRIYFVVRVEILDRLICQRDVMRADFAADFCAACPCFTNESHTACGRDVLAVNVMIAEFREQNVAHHHRFLARRRPARQTEQGAPVAFVHHAVADQIVILAMIKHGQINHPGVLDRAPHHLVILYAMTVVRDRDHARLRK